MMDLYAVSVLDAASAAPNEFVAMFCRDTPHVVICVVGDAQRGDDRAT
jgi:hypothetical protein